MSVLTKILHRILIVFLLAGSAQALLAQSPIVREYQVKSVFLYNFSQFVDWPSKGYLENSSPLIIGILGNDPFGAYLDEVVKGEVINGHPVVVKRFTTVDEAAKCQILFINSSNKDKIKQTLGNLKGHSILTVSDDEDFIQYGGMIRFVTVNNKIKLQINPDAAKAQGLSISSKLLRLAEIVTPSKRK